MSLVTETGAGLADAESYISVADATSYHAARGNAAWAELASDTVREQLLRKATGYMLQAYRDRWQGYRLTQAQALDWPRSCVIVDGWSVAIDIVPTEVKNACAELALRASSADLAPDLTRGVVRERVGPIETEYDRYASQQANYQAVDAMLAPYLTGGGAMARVIRT